MGFSFEGKRVLVTGGAGGLGSSIVRKFIESGAIVYALDFNESQLEKLQSDLPSVQTVLADLSKWDETRKIVEALGTLDHLVNSAAFATSQNILEVTEDSFDSVMNVNLKAVFNLSQVFSKNVITNSIKGATIVNISSVASIRHVAKQGLATYECSKAGLNMMTKAFAVEMGPYGIRVNSILPTAMDTPLFRSVNTEEKQAALKKSYGVLDIKDAANLVLYLSSPLSQMVTGTNIPIDGGVLAAL